jgi:hypothetical protein
MIATWTRIVRHSLTAPAAARWQNRAVLTLQKIVSGGQTGADRAALDWAIAHGLAHGGWCPRGRRAEDGRIPKRYTLEETPASVYSQRTRWNVRDSDGTLIICRAEHLTGGSGFTARCADELGKPWLHVLPGNEAALARWLECNRIKVLNVAGPRASSDPQIYRYARQVLDGAFALEPLLR